MLSFFLKLRTKISVLDNLNAHGWLIYIIFIGYINYMHIYLYRRICPGSLVRIDRVLSYYARNICDDMTRCVSCYRIGKGHDFQDVLRVDLGSLRRIGQLSYCQASRKKAREGYQVS